jgi:hypothetical protein
MARIGIIGLGLALIMCLGNGDTLSASPGSEPASRPSRSMSLDERSTMFSNAVNANPPDWAKASAALEDAGNVLMMWVRTRDANSSVNPIGAFTRQEPGPVPKEWLDHIIAARNAGYWLSMAMVFPVPTEAVRRKRDLILAQADEVIRKGLLALAKDYPQLKNTVQGPLEERLKGKSPAGRISVWINLHPTPDKPASKNGPWISVSIEPLRFDGDEGVRQMTVPPLIQLDKLALMGIVKSNSYDANLDAAVMKVVDGALSPLNELNRAAGEARK